jgi:predicted phosphodiesterase
MKIAVEGCCHGELDAIYASIKRLETEKSQKIDLLLIGGDFQVSHITAYTDDSPFVIMQIWHVSLCRRSIVV